MYSVFVCAFHGYRTRGTEHAISLTYSVFVSSFRVAPNVGKTRDTRDCLFYCGCYCCFSAFFFPPPISAGSTWLWAGSGRVSSTWWRCKEQMEGNPTPSCNSCPESYGWVIRSIPRGIRSYRWGTLCKLTCCFLMRETHFFVFEEVPLYAASVLSTSGMHAGSPSKYGDKEKTNH